MSTAAQFIDAWIKRLRGAARPALEGTPIGAPWPDDASDPEPKGTLTSEAARRVKFIDAFADGAGNRRALDRPLLAHVLMCPAGPAPALEELSVETMAWWGLHDRTAIARLGLEIDATGPFFPRLRAQGIEAWTEAELCGLHALLWEGLRGCSEPMVRRCFAAARWLVEELQPDNATQRPWAVQAFVVMACDPRASDANRGAADVYAQTLLHNALVGGKEPDVFSAVILWDGAEWLDSAHQVVWQKPPEDLVHVAPTRKAK